MMLGAVQCSFWVKESKNHCKALRFEVISPPRFRAGLEMAISLISNLLRKEMSNGKHVPYWLVQVIESEELYLKIRRQTSYLGGPCIMDLRGNDIIN